MEMKMCHSGGSRLAFPEDWGWTADLCISVTTTLPLQSIIAFYFFTRGINPSVRLLFFLSTHHYHHAHRWHRQRKELQERWQQNTSHTGLSKGGRAETGEALGHRCWSRPRAQLAPASGQQGGRQAGQPMETSGGPVQGQPKPLTLHFLLR